MTDPNLKMPVLNEKEIIDYAKRATKYGIPFHKFVDLISQTYFYGRPYEKVRCILVEMGINLYFEGFADGQKHNQSTDENEEV